jgi:hypothetical protein
MVINAQQNCFQKYFDHFSKSSKECFATHVIARITRYAAYTDQFVVSNKMNKFWHGATGRNGFVACLSI